MEKPYFPMFVDLNGKKVLTAGGGRIALRRVRTLLRFGARIHVTAPDLCEELAELEDQGRITADRREYRMGDAEGYDLVLAATNSRAVNRMMNSVLLISSAGVSILLFVSRKLSSSLR